MLRRLGDSECDILIVQTNLSNSYSQTKRLEQAVQMDRDIYHGRLKLNGVEHKRTVIAASNYASSLVDLQRFEEAKSLLRKMMPVARRVLGEYYDTTLRMKWNYAEMLYKDEGATLDDLHKAVTTLEDAAPGARRVLGAAHPLTQSLEDELQNARAALRARDDACDYDEPD
jgi:hypothetical protein